MKNNTTKVLLFMTLCLLLIGIVSATDVESTEIPTTDTISESTDVAYTEPIVEDNVIANKQLEKKDLSNEENIKTDTKLQSKIAIDQFSSINIDDWALIGGRVTDVNNNPIRYVPIKIDVNGDAYETETDYSGDFFGEYIPDTHGQHIITISFAGNSRYLPSTAKSTFNVVGQAKTYIDLNTINEVTIGNNVVISGRYYYGFTTPLPYTTMRLNINGQQYLTKTDTNGYFTYNYKTTKTGTNTVTVYYPGNTNYKAASESTTFNVKSNGPQTTYITLNNINEVLLGNSASLTGRYYYGNNIPLPYTVMRLNINGQQYLTKTDSQGYYTYTYKTTKIGSNTVTVSYPGNTNYKAASVTKTFNVKSNGPQTTYITVNNINEVLLGNSASITGRYYYGNNIPLPYTVMRLNINGQQYLTKTDSQGYFTYTYKTTKTGTNTVTVSYPGNTNYKAASVTKTFNVKSNGPQTTYITLNNIPDVYKGNYVTIAGKYYYGNNIALPYTLMRLNINGQQYTTKTDRNGDFTYNYYTEKIGQNTVTVSYPGNVNYKAASVSKTFNVKVINPIDTFMYIECDANVKLGDSIKFIGGYAYYGKDDYIPLPYTLIRLNINGESYSTKTDRDGYFTYSYKTKKAGFNKVTASYPGNANFNGDSDWVIFNVYENKISLNVIPLTRGNGAIAYKDKDYFETWYQTYDAQSDKGVHLSMHPQDMEDLGDAPYNLLLDATFYFKNNAGEIYTDTYEIAYDDYMYHSLVPGYMPYRIDAYYRKMSQYERNLHESGYGYDHSTGQWYYPNYE